MHIILNRFRYTPTSHLSKKLQESILAGANFVASSASAAPSSGGSFQVDERSALENQMVELGGLVAARKWATCSQFIDSIPKDRFGQILCDGFAGWLGTLSAAAARSKDVSVSAASFQPGDSSCIVGNLMTLTSH